SLTIANVPPLAITTTSPLPSGSVGISYSQTLAATGGTPPYSWSLSSDSSLPPGLNFFASGELYGTPTAEGSFNFPIRVTDSDQRTAEKAFSLTTTIPLTVTTTSPLPSGIIGAAYSQNLTAAGGKPPYTWSMASGSLPQGMNLSLGGV